MPGTAASCFSTTRSIARGSRFGAAIRHDDNDRFEDDDTFRLQGSYRFDNGTRLRAAAGSGIKNPGIFELFGFDPDSFIGNPNLKPEKSQGWEVGVDQSFAASGLARGLHVLRQQAERRDRHRLPAAPSCSRPRISHTESTQKGVEVFARGASTTHGASTPRTRTWMPRRTGSRKCAVRRTSRASMWAGARRARRAA